MLRAFRCHSTTFDPSFYGLHERSFDPFAGAPRNAAVGGVLYFRDRVDKSALTTALGVAGVRLDSPMSEFIVFEGESADPRERYLRQIRLMRTCALQVRIADAGA